MGKRIAAGAALFCASLLLIFPSIWDYTPVPDVAGDALYRVRDAQERAAFGAALLASPAATELSVPVIGVEAADIADSYGAPRGNRRHEGLDLFAPRGTYVISATPGIVARIGQNRLGGNVVYILGPGGERYYYAHLDTIDPLLTVGQIVSTTTLLGTVGTSGNAADTPPHLHFGAYGQEGALNPFERF